MHGRLPGPLRKGGWDDDETNGPGEGCVYANLWLTDRPAQVLRHWARACRLYHRSLLGHSRLWVLRRSCEWRGRMPDHLALYEYPHSARLVSGILCSRLPQMRSSQARTRRRPKRQVSTIQSVSSS